LLRLKIYKEWMRIHGRQGGINNCSFRSLGDRAKRVKTHPGGNNAKLWESRPLFKEGGDLSKWIDRKPDTGARVDLGEGVLGAEGDWKRKPAEDNEENKGRNQLIEKGRVATGKKCERKNGQTDQIGKNLSSGGYNKRRNGPREFGRKGS